MVFHLLEGLLLILVFGLLTFTADGFNLLNKVKGGDHRARPYHKLLVVVIDG